MRRGSWYLSPAQANSAMMRRQRDIPKKLIISKRLAQCLNPALPAGIHQKTLDVYHLIFSTIGPAGMSKDLGIYSFGLFPFLQHAQMSLKPMLLTIYADFYAKLDRRVLRPPLFGLILALLPGLDEEGNEFFDRFACSTNRTPNPTFLLRVLGILDSLSRQVGQGYFFECIWLVLVKVSHLRNAALAYLLKRMPKFTSGEGMLLDRSLARQHLLRNCSCAWRRDWATSQRSLCYAW